jgi:hypothetical protein
MLNHWSNVEDCAELLAQYTIPYDSNGVEVGFMSKEFGKDAFKDASNIRKLVHDNKPLSTGNPSRIDKSLAAVLHKYSSRIDSKWKLSPKKRLFFVLTDGLCLKHYDVKGPIGELVETMRQRRLAPGYAGIQFLQFGNDLDAQNKLAELDDFMNPNIYA